MPPAQDPPNQSKEICFQNGPVSLRGSLTLGLRKQGAVVVLMLHGSGPLDRNANIPGQDANIFNAIAETLSRAGIHSFRYDKRGCGDSLGDYLSAGLADLTLDACAAVDVLGAQPDCDTILLLAHSEGTIIAPVVAQLRPQVAGMILLCPTVQPVEATLMRQAQIAASIVENMPGLRGVSTRLLTRLTGGIAPRQRRLIHRIKTSDKTTFRAMGQSIPAKMLRDLFAHDLAAWIAKTQIPLLAISGAQDIQCLPSDAERIAGLAQGPVETHCLNRLTHVLRADDAPASFARYPDLLAKELDPRITPLCIDWIVRLEFNKKHDAHPPHPQAPKIKSSRFACTTPDCSPVPADSTS